MGSLVALDIEDLEMVPDGERHYLIFRNRPETGTRLRKGANGERPVMLSETVYDVVRTYIEDYRHETTDEFGREPLITSNQGRPSKGSIRTWTYAATLPCLHSPCPHGEDPATCEYKQHNKQPGCPSSRSGDLDIQNNTKYDEN